ncbi:cupin domain-containing protein [Paraburkholderia sp. DHOC27]|uniref:cupin domain-containing protein n=1 Tax=Paraburkholderia sp. DHOC27 TaxID=2303330 RepID=UPI000E3CD2F0|nr:cupin domain-containing protein [Paraburkholderia sp. DHOC27]RFU45281.1 cupin domain-containing protein [Paraburkholderia sp. DHOC27]
MFNDAKHAAMKRAAGAARSSYEIFMLEPHDWVPNNSKLPVVIYRHALQADSGDLASAFELLFERNEWPPQWRAGIFDYHHFHATAHEVLGIASGSAEVIVGGPGGRVVHVEAGDALLLPAGTGHCLQSYEGRFQVVGGYPAGQQWDIRREALTPDEVAVMEALPFPACDPVDGTDGPVVTHWLHAS